MRKILIGCLILIACISFSSISFSEDKKQDTGKVKSKFYDFSDQLIDGSIKSPSALYTDAKQKVEFGRLLKLKKTLLPALLSTAKDPALK
jgi:hypothetical protein